MTVLLAAGQGTKRARPVHVHNYVLVQGYKRVEELEPRLARILEPILRRAGERAGERFLAMATDHLTAAGWTAPAGDELIDVPALVATLKTKTDPVRLEVVKTMMTPPLEAAGLSFDVTNPLTAKVLAQSGSQITSIAETTQLNVMRTINEAYKQGLSIPDTATAIKAGMADASTARATLIARTELVGAVNGGSLAATQIVSEETGTSYFKQWLTAEGAKFPRHEEYDGLDGQTVHLDDTFEVGADQLQYPGDPDGSPDEVCNCRCTLVYTDDASQLTDGGTGGGVDDAAAGDQTSAGDEGVAEEVAPVEAEAAVGPVEGFPVYIEDVNPVAPALSDLPAGGAAAFRLQLGAAPRANDLYQQVMARRAALPANDVRLSQMEEALRTAVVTDVRDEQTVVHALIGKDSQAQAAIAYRVISGRAVVIENLGSVAPRGGTAMVKLAARDALKADLPVEAAVLPDASGFYERLGFVKDEARPGNVYVLDRDGVAKLLAPEPTPPINPSLVPTESEPFTIGNASAYYPGPPEEAVADVNRWHENRMSAWQLSSNVPASMENLDAASLEKKADEITRQAVAGKAVQIRVDSDVLGKILDDGRFKSQFETGTSKGALNHSSRSAAEERMFGYPRDLDPALRPVYGYIDGSSESEGMVGSYGTIKVVFKDSVRARTTASFGDSLGTGGREMLPQPVTDMNSLANPDTPFRGWQIAESEGRPVIGKDLDGGVYTEAQIHGGLPVADIARVEFPPLSSFEEPMAARWREKIAERQKEIDALLARPDGASRYAETIAMHQERLNEYQSYLNEASPSGYDALKARLDAANIPWAHRES